MDIFRYQHSTKGKHLCVTGQHYNFHKNKPKGVFASQTQTVTLTELQVQINTSWPSNSKKLFIKLHKDRYKF